METIPEISFLPNIICTTEGCTHDISIEFNRMRFAVFSIAKRKYAGLRDDIATKHSFEISRSTRNTLARHDQGVSFDDFNIKCPACKKRSSFKVNTLTGDTLTRENTPLTFAVLEVPMTSISLGNLVGPEWEYPAPQQNYPLVYIPDTHHIRRYPSGDCVLII